MTDLPRLIAGDHPTEEHIRVMEAYMREEDWTVAPSGAGRRLTAEDYNAAVDWWNALPTEDAAVPAHHVTVKLVQGPASEPPPDATILQMPGVGSVAWFEPEGPTS